MPLSVQGTTGPLGLAVLLHGVLLVLLLWRWQAAPDNAAQTQPEIIDAQMVDASPARFRRSLNTSGRAGVGPGVPAPSDSKRAVPEAPESAPDEGAAARVAAERREAAESAASQPVVDEQRAARARQMAEDRAAAQLAARIETERARRMATERALKASAEEAGRVRDERAARAEAERRQVQARIAAERQASARAEAEAGAEAERLAREKALREAAAAERAERERRALESQRRKAELAARERAAGDARAKAEAAAREKWAAERAAQARAEGELQQQMEQEAQQRAAAAQRQQERALQAELDRESAAGEEARIDDEAQRWAVRKIKPRITARWVRPASAVRGMSCRMRVSMDPEGRVLDVVVVHCTADTAFARSAEAAVRKASPLPMPPAPEVAAKLRSFQITFQPE